MRTEFPTQAERRLTREKGRRGAGRRTAWWRSTVYGRRAQGEARQISTVDEAMRRGEGKSAVTAEVGRVERGGGGGEGGWDFFGGGGEAAGKLRGEKENGGQREDEGDCGI